MRKILQIAAMGVENNHGTQCNAIVLALCDDGTLWEIRDNTSQPAWCQYPQIPQDETLRDRLPETERTDGPTTG